eukprot:TRINITY_DN48234_c0_g1_i1.p1 TRINITY_DN48234_c0_g1~~TRINITY_DN48234_c0_g1_i1.p1  ORF type:complete len:336 (+),score=80.85 TRINITY_DN48234_c0_g1_i1:45-1052(+)
MPSMANAADIPIGPAKRQRLNSAMLLSAATGISIEDLMTKVNLKRQEEGLDPVTADQFENTITLNAAKDEDDMDPEDDLEDRGDEIAKATEILREVKSKIAAHDAIIKELIEDTYKNRVRIIAKAGLKPKEFHTAVRPFVVELVKDQATAFVQTSRLHIDVTLKSTLDIKDALLRFKQKATDKSAADKVVFLPPYSPATNLLRLCCKAAHRATIRCFSATLGLEDGERLPKEALPTTSWPKGKYTETTEYNASLEIKEKTFMDMKINAEKAFVELRVADTLQITKGAATVEVDTRDLCKEIRTCWNHPFEVRVNTAAPNQLRKATPPARKGGGKG